MQNVAHSIQEPRSQLVRAWVVTVINPIIEAVPREQYWLKKKNWSWQYITGWFEYLAPISGYIDLRYHANYELFREYYQEIAKLFDEHDKSLDKLAIAIGSIYKKFLKLSNFHEEFQKLEREAQKKGIDYESAWGAVPEKDRQKLLIQYIINNTQELPSFYTMSKLWNTFGKRFLTLRNNPAVKSMISDIDSHGRNVLNISKKIEKKLKDLRNEYARKYDIPPIPFEES